MRDPFAPKTKSRALRDTSLSMAAVAALLSLFAYVSYQRITGTDSELPDHVRLAPVAEMVWPDHRPLGADEVARGERSQNERRPATQNRRARSGAVPNAATNQITDSGVPASKQHNNARRPTANSNKPIGGNDFARAQTAPRTHTTQTAIADPSVALAQFQQAAQEVNAAIAEIEHMTRRQTSAAKRMLRPTASDDKSPLKREESASPRNSNDQTATRIKSVAADTTLIPARPKAATKKSIAANSFALPKIRPLRQVPQPVTKQNPKQTAKSMPVGSPSPASLRVSPSRPIIAPPVAIGQTAGRGQAFPSSILPVASTPPRDIARPISVAADATTQNTASVAAPGSTEPTDTYIVQQGDSFWSIATERYGDGRLFRALYRWNVGAADSFESPTPGVRLNIPAPDRLVQRWPELCPQDLVQQRDTENNRYDLVGYDQSLSERLYITRDGDTLFQIAAQRLGQASRYLEIIAVNDVRLPVEVGHLSPLTAGLKLVLPEL